MIELRVPRALAFLVALAAPPAAAQVCVACNEPSAAYRCVIEDPAAAGHGGERALQFVCITELARRFGHGTCWVRRDLVPGCDANEQRVSIGAALAGTPLLPAPLSEAPAPPGAPPSAGSPAAVQKAPADPGVPQTIEEVARRTAQGSSEELKKAGNVLKKTGETVGDVFQATVTCITSLFQRCRGN